MVIAKRRAGWPSPRVLSNREEPPPLAVRSVIMPEILETPVSAVHETGFVDRRQIGAGRGAGSERRQFVDSRTACRPEVRELAEAVDRYKLLHRRRFISFEELFDVMASLGYHK